MINSCQYRILYMSDILTALHIKKDEFIYNLINYSPYEITLYLWINKLYSKGKSTDDAIQLIYKARNMFLLKNDTLCNNLLFSHS